MVSLICLSFNRRKYPIGLEVIAMQRRFMAKWANRAAAMTLVAMGLTIGGPTLLPATAQTCASQCATPPIQFQPGQRIEVQVHNRTQTPIMMENTQGDREVVLQPGQKLKFYRGGSTDPNLSIAFWEKTETPLNLALSKPKANILQIEVRFARQAPGDRSIYIANDGQIQRL
jgi:hypothetical protein